MAPRAAGDQMWQRRLAHQQCALEVDVEHPLPGALIELVEPRAAGGNADVVDENIQPAVALDRGSDGALTIREARNVGGAEHGLAAVGRDHAFGRSGASLVLVDQADARAFARKQISDRLAGADALPLRAGARDQRAFAGQSTPENLRLRHRRSAPYPDLCPVRYYEHHLST